MAELGNGRGDDSFTAAVDDDARAFGGQRFCDGQADASGGGGDEGEFVVELKIFLLVEG
ncbi:MAG: hypothetical protein ACREU0_08440 [Burkholderiales bacterium]